MQNKKTRGTKQGLNRLVALLQREYLTARQVAQRLRCSRLFAYRKLNQLLEAGFSLRVKQIRERPTGPLAKAYRLG